MPGYNLVRNTKALFTTNLSAVNAINLTGHLATTTYELQLMNGFSFSQNAETQAITVSEAGNTVARSQRTFNTALAPVDFSFTTYLRPSGTTTVTCEERVLWNALLNNNVIDTTGMTVTAAASMPSRSANAAAALITAATTFNFQAATIYIDDVVTIQGVAGTEAAEWNMPVKIVSFVGGTNITTAAGTTNAAATGVNVLYLKAPTGASLIPPSGGTAFKMFKGAFVQNTSYSLIHSGGSNKNQMSAFGMIIIIDDVTYVIDNCCLDQAQVDFGLDGIAMVQWTGKGTTLRVLGATTLTTGTFGGVAGITGTYAQKVTTANFITRKLSTLTLKSTIRGLGTGAVTYTIPITGGSMTIANNITYVTPEILGIVNQPIGYFTGTRAITGNLTAYLKAGTNNSGGLLSSILGNITASTETKYMVQVEVGGINNATRVEFEMPATMIQVPTIDAQDVISTSIAFTAQGFDGSSSLAATVLTSNYDVDQANDLFIRYYSAA